VLSCLALLVLLVVVNLRVPEQGLVSITPEKVLSSYILVWVFRSVLQRRQMLPMAPMLIPKIVRVDASNEEAGNSDIEGQLAPQITGCRSMILHSFSLTVESVVLSSMQTTALSARQASLNSRSCKW